MLADKPLFYWTFDEPNGPAIEQVRGLWNQALYPRGDVRRCSHSSHRQRAELGSGRRFQPGQDGFFVSDGFGARPYLRHVGYRVLVPVHRRP